MCGYSKRRVSQEDLEAYMEAYRIAKARFNFPVGPEPVTQHFYPAFGGAANKQIKDLIIREDGEVKTVDATWWYHCIESNGQLIVDNKLTTFNARNLENRYWRDGIRHHRGILIASAIGEGKEETKIINGIEKKKKHSYLVEGETPLYIGAVYRRYPNHLYSTAIITRNEHPRFSQYHDKAFPLFLPADPAFLELWLSDEPETHPAIAHLLENPRIFNRLIITEVKTFKDAKSLGPTVFLEPDEAA
jgi:putative SOS response-associated peptidase YedK